MQAFPWLSRRESMWEVSVLSIVSRAKSMTMDFGAFNTSEKLRYATSRLRVFTGECAEVSVAEALLPTPPAEPAGVARIFSQPEIYGRG
jgi:hypothetical protein